MKLARKLVTLAIVLAMVMAFMVPTAMAASIEVKDVVNGESYTAYKILNYTTNAGENVPADEAAYSYYLATAEYNQIGSVLEAAGFAFTASADGSQYYVNNAESFDAAAAAAYLAEHANSLGDALGKYTVTGADGQANFTDLGTGYYFVTSTTGSLCALHSETDIATTVEKNTVPSIDKKQSTDGTNYADALVELSVGDTVYYQIEVTNGKGTNQDIVLVDELSNGLTLNDGSITVKVGDATVDADNYAVSNKTAQGFTLTLLADYVKTLAENAVVTIEYSAVVDTDAVIRDTDANKNTVTMTYANQTATDTVKLATYDFLVKKTDGTKFLDGAEFKLYTEATGGTQIKLTADATGYDVDVNGSADTTIVVNSENGINVHGLKPGTYYLEEVVVPAGYNKLAARVAVTVVNGANAGEVVVVNQAGAVLPTTGGIGTTIFYVLGGVLFLGALVILFTNKRMRQN